MMFFSSTQEQLQSRSVYIKIYPTARKLRDTKLVLAALQKFGEVVAFHTSKYDPVRYNPVEKAVIHATFDSPQAAQSAIDSSPLRIDRSNKEPINFESPDTDANAHTGIETDTTSQNCKSQGWKGTRARPISLECKIRPSTFHHGGMVRRNPFRQRFVQNVDSPIFQDLAKKLDQGLGPLADVPLAKKERMSDEQRRNAHEAVAQLGGKSLMGLWTRSSFSARETFREMRREKRREKWRWIDKNLADLEKEKEEVEREVQGEEGRRGIAELEKKIEDLNAWKDIATETEMRWEKEDGVRRASERAWREKHGKVNKENEKAKEVTEAQGGDVPEKLKDK
ncbi:hypothetical protein BDW62DRAFT_36449 [Aspergillus aurantiobrunneus]